MRPSLPNLPIRGRRFEFVVAVLAISALGLILLDALKDSQDESERLTVELTIRNMNTGLFLLQAERLAAGREDSLRELAGQNPVSWLRTLPAGYIGERSCAAELAVGQWCWDPKLKLLYYFPQGGNGLKNPRSVPWLTWQVDSAQHARHFRPGSFRLQAVGESQQLKK